jgi:hypothetical protein
MKYYLKKLYLSILASILILITTITVTYAWITLSNDAYTESIKFDIAGGDGMQISLDGVNFYNYIGTTLFKDELMAHYGYTRDNLNNFKYHAMSLENPNDPESDFLELRENKLLSENYELKRVENNKNYLDFDLYFTTDLNTNISEGIYQGIGVSFTGEIFDSHATDYKLLHKIHHIGLNDDLDKIKVNASNAMRLSTTVYSPVDKGDLTNASNSIVRKKIYYQGSDTYQSLVEGYDFGNLRCQNVANEYFYKLTGFNPQNLSNYSDTVFRLEERILNKRIIEPDLYLVSGKMIKVHFKIWLEGWDPDCFDACANQIINLNLRFKTTY